MVKGFFSIFARRQPRAGPEEAVPEAENPASEAMAVESEIVCIIARQALPVAPRKAAISLRLDADVLEWFRARGPGYQTRINAVLRAYMEAAG